MIRFMVIPWGQRERGMVHTSHQQLSVLIVEDEYHTRMAMARKLQAGG